MKKSTLSAQDSYQPSILEAIRIKTEITSCEAVESGLKESLNKLKSDTLALHHQLGLKILFNRGIQPHIQGSWYNRRVVLNDQQHIATPQVQFIQYIVTNVLYCIDLPVDDINKQEVSAQFKCAPTAKWPQGRILFQRVDS